MKKIKIILSTLVFFLSMNIVYSYDYLPDDMSLSDALLLIAHNSPQNKEDGWVYAQQKGNLEKQWQAGARGAKVNLHWRKEESFARQVARLTEKEQENHKPSGWKRIKCFFTGEDPYKRKEPFIALCHDPDGKSNCMLSLLQKAGGIDHAEDYCRRLAKLLEDHPKDVFIVIFEDYLQQASQKNNAVLYTPQQRREKLEQMIERSGLAKYVLLLKPEHKKSTWPTIGEMRKTGKRAILFTNEGEHFKNSRYLNHWGDFARATHWNYRWQDDLGKTCKMYLQNQAKAFLVVHGAEWSIPKGTKTAGLISVINKIKKIEVEGVKVEETDYALFNSEKIIRQRLSDCMSVDKLPASMLMMDYIEIPGNDGKTVYETIKKINMERIAAKTVAMEKQKNNQNILELAKNGDFSRINELTDVNQKDSLGMIALMYAVKWNKLDVVKDLVLKGADINAKNNEGFTALSLAKEKDIVDFLNVTKEERDKIEKKQAEELTKKGEVRKKLITDALDKRGLGKFIPQILADDKIETEDEAVKVAEMFKKQSDMLEKIKMMNEELDKKSGEREKLITDALNKRGLGKFIPQILADGKIKTEDEAVRVAEILKKSEDTIEKIKMMSKVKK